MREADKKETFGDLHTDTLVDIRNISVDKALPRKERVTAFVQQIRDPYCFRCGGFIVHASFTEAGPALEDCLLGILR